MNSSTLFYAALFGVICLVLCDVDSTIQKGADSAKAGVHETESVFGPAAKGLEQSAHNIGAKFEHGFENLKSGINEKTAAARGSLGDTLRSGANKIDPASHISSASASEHHNDHGKDHH